MHGRSINSLVLPPDDSDDLTMDQSLIDRTLRVLTASPSELALEAAGNNSKRSERKWIIGIIIICLLFLGCFLGLFLPSMKNSTISSSSTQNSSNFTQSKNSSIEMENFN